MSMYNRFLWHTGARYIGEWSGNIKQGHGLFSFEDGSVYEGPFEADRMTDGQVSLCTRVPSLTHTERFVLTPRTRRLLRQLRATSELYTYLDLGHLIPASVVDTTCNAVRHVLVRHNTDLKQVCPPGRLRVAPNGLAEDSHVFREPLLWHLH